MINIGGCVFDYTTIPFILLRTTFLDWAFDEWGTAGGFTVWFIIVVVTLFIGWLHKRSNAGENIAEPQDEDQPPPDSPPPPDEE